MSPLPRPRALLLDLDGTLIDSAPDIARALAETLAAYGLPPLAEVAVRPRVCHGVAPLVENGFAAVGRPLARADPPAGPAAMFGASRAPPAGPRPLIEARSGPCAGREAPGTPP